jgi:uncharacterized membrane protein YfcA
MDQAGFLFYFAAGLAVLLVGIAKTGFGGGIGVVAVPLMMAAAPREMRGGTEQAVLLPILCFCDLFALYFFWKKWSVRDVIRLLPGGILGIVIGAFLMGRVTNHKAPLQLAIGLLSVIFVLYQLGRTWILKRMEAVHPGWGLGTTFGGLAGFASMVAHAGGPPVVMYLLPRDLPRQIFVGTTVVFFATVNYAKLIPYSSLGLFTWDRFLLSLALAPLVPVGTWLGARLNHWISERAFRIVVYTLLLATGIKLVLQGI